MERKRYMVQVVVENDRSNSISRLTMTVAAPWGSCAGGLRFKKQRLTQKAQNLKRKASSK